MSDPSIMKDAQTEQHLSTQNAALPEDTLLSHPWLRHYQEGVPAHLPVSDQPLTWLLDQTVSEYPDQTAIIFMGKKLSYAQLGILANRFAMGLLQLGIKKGDRVAIALPNIPQYPIAFYGALKAGAVVVPTNPLYTERELQHQMADSGARILIMLDDFYPMARAIRANTALEHIILTSPADFLPPVLRVLYPLGQRKAKHPEPRLTDKERAEDTTLHSMSGMLQSQTRLGIETFDLPEPAVSSDLAILQYTGGTTGLSKGAMLTHRNVLSNALQCFAWTPQVRPAQEVSLCVAPFFHSYGLRVGMNYSIRAAATMVLLPRFNAKDVVRSIRRYRATMLPGIPTMYIAIIREATKTRTDLRSIKYCISGAAPLPAKVRTDFEEMTGGRLVEGYGLSEASPVTHCNPLNGDVRDGSIGLPFPDVEAAILDRETGKQLPASEVGKVDKIGEIIVKGPNIMQGYWNNEEETAAIFQNGWMRTGDIGKMDEEGYFYVVDRAKDLIIAGGFNIYPREVEEVLFQHPSVLEGAVVGVPDEYRGETVAAFVVLKPGIEPAAETRQDILAYCKQNLTTYKVPKILEFRTELPKTLIGKVLRRELKTTKQ